MAGSTERPSETLATLDDRALKQRQRLLDRIRIVQDRLRPANLSHEAGNRVLDLGLDTMERARGMIRANPLKAAAGAVAAGAFLARKPLLQWLAAGYARLRGTGKANDAASGSEPSD